MFTLLLFLRRNNSCLSYEHFNSEAEANAAAERRAEFDRSNEYRWEVRPGSVVRPATSF